MFITNNHALFHLWCKVNLVKHQKLTIYYDHDFLENFYLSLMSLLTAEIVKNIYLSKKRPRPNLKLFQYQSQIRKDQKVVIKQDQF